MCLPTTAFASPDLLVQQRTHKPVQTHLRPALPLTNRVLDVAQRTLMQHVVVITLRMVPRDRVARLDFIQDPGVIAVLDWEDKQLFALMLMSIRWCALRLGWVIYAWMYRHRHHHPLKEYVAKFPLDSLRVHV
jgi:hypothetical protein